MPSQDLLQLKNQQCPTTSEHRLLGKWNEAAKTLWHHVLSNPTYSYDDIYLKKVLVDQWVEEMGFSSKERKTSLKSLGCWEINSALNLADLWSLLPNSGNYCINEHSIYSSRQLNDENERNETFEQYKRKQFSKLIPFVAHFLKNEIKQDHSIDKSKQLLNRLVFKDHVFTNPSPGHHFAHVDSENFELVFNVLYDLFTFDLHAPKSDQLDPSIFAIHEAIGSQMESFISTLEKEEQLHFRLKWQTYILFAGHFNHLQDRLGEEPDEFYLKRKLNFETNEASLYSLLKDEQVPEKLAIVKQHLPVMEAKSNRTFESDATFSQLKQWAVIQENIKTVALSKESKPSPLTPRF